MLLAPELPIHYLTEILTTTPLYRWGNWGWERFSKLLKDLPREVREVAGLSFTGGLVLPLLTWPLPASPLCSSGDLGPVLKCYLPIQILGHTPRGSNHQQQGAGIKTILHTYIKFYCFPSICVAIFSTFIPFWDPVRQERQIKNQDPKSSDFSKVSQQAHSHAARLCFQEAGGRLHHYIPTGFLPEFPAPPHCKSISL